MKSKAPANYSLRIKHLRQKYGITQTQLAERLGVSFASINRWENEQSKPNPSAWRNIEKAELLGLQAFEVEGTGRISESQAPYQTTPIPVNDLDFSSSPDIVRTVVEGYRLAFGHQHNPTFASEVSLIDPLPHQRVAVYDHMLPQPRLRYLLADDAGAGKTIMSGLYIREMLSRRLIQRVLIIPPAGLVGNWERELRKLFGLHFRIISGNDVRNNNPFKGDDSNFLIISIDTLASERVFNRLKEPEVAPYDLVIFDEAHKLSANREPDFRIRKTDRYRLAESLAGVYVEQERWRLPWSARHLILLTATPHMGKDFPYYCLWRLLEPEVLSTYDAFIDYPPDERKKHFIRRTKEEMVYFDGTPIYPIRISDTLSYDLTQGPVSEQQLYDQTTAYIEYYYNRARMLNRSAARLAMSVFQRRLASSTWALLCSLERRMERLAGMIDDIRNGRISSEQLQARQNSLDSEVVDPFEQYTADEETPEGEREGNEVSEDQALQAVVVTSLAELEAERLRVETLLSLAKKVFEQGQESKFEKLLEVLSDPRFKEEKFIIFTEHRDTLNFLIRRLEGMGFTGQITQIHGGMDRNQREQAETNFRKPLAEGGAKYLIATDAAGEGINLQVCWLMVNYDIPWNPARLEQRMGRIHRYGQKHDPVFIINLLAGKTREGRVMRTLLEKLERIRKQLNSDKVFDVVGRLFEGVSLRAYLEQAISDEGADRAVQKLESTLTPDQVTAIQEREKRLFGDGGDVKRLLPKLQKDLDQEAFRRLMPGYVRNFFERAAEFENIGIEGDPEQIFHLIPLKTSALDRLWPFLEIHPAENRNHFSFTRPGIDQASIFLHPGEVFFDQFLDLFLDDFGHFANRGAVFYDPSCDQPYLFHLMLVNVVRQANPASISLALEEILETCLVAMRENLDGQFERCPVETLLILPSGRGMPANALALASAARERLPEVEEHIGEFIIKPMVDGRKAKILADLPEREDLLRKGFNFQEAELATARARFREQAADGDPRARGEITRIKERQQRLAARRDSALADLRREPDLIAPGTATFLAHALVIPSSEPADVEHRDQQVEEIAMRVAVAYEEANSAKVWDVHTPELARAASLSEFPGFDLLSRWPDGSERAIEVKGRVRSGDILVSENEWAAACNHRQKYWLYVVYDCGTATPTLIPVNDPWAKIIVKARGFQINAADITHYSKV